MKIMSQLALLSTHDFEEWAALNNWYPIRATNNTAGHQDKGKEERFYEWEYLTPRGDRVSVQVVTSPYPEGEDHVIWANVEDKGAY